MFSFLLFAFGIFLVFISYKRFQIARAKAIRLQNINLLLCLEAIFNPELKDAYEHWDYEKCCNDIEFFSLDNKEYVRKYYWFYNLPDQRIHYRKENFYDMKGHERLKA